MKYSYEETNIFNGGAIYLSLSYLDSIQKYLKIQFLAERKCITSPNEIPTGYHCFRKLE
jgi:hypothetical protein